MITDILESIALAILMFGGIIGALIGLVFIGLMIDTRLHPEHYAEPEPPKWVWDEEDDPYYLSSDGDPFYYGDN